MYPIAAISTAIGVGAIAIVRLSGEGCLAMARRHFRCASCAEQPTPNYMYLGHFEGQGYRELCFLVYFAAPRSYTGEDMVELQVHGGIAVAQLVLNTLYADGARPAQNGEFTRRAYLNGKMTLSQAEGIHDVIAATSAHQLNAAYSLVNGSLGARITPLMARLQMLLTTIEAALDYPDEMADQIDNEFSPTVRALVRDLTVLANTAHDGKMARDGITVAIVGRPNAGKSSLLNCILHEERAIVTPIAGTTRDTICESVLVGGVKLNLLDTAGLRDSADPVEQMGVERALRSAQNADALVYVIDATTGEAADADLLQQVTGKVFVVYNKADLAPVPTGCRGVCAVTGEGVDRLLADIAAIALSIPTDGGVLVQQRHVAAVGVALRHLQNALAHYDDVPLDCTALDIRAAYAALGEIDGATAGDNILDGIFANFCVGK